MKDGLTVNEVSKLTGVTVRALHYYDSIGLLRPSCMTEAGYRLYGTESLERLQQILFFRELDFKLEDIVKILDDPNFDKNAALVKHRELLTLQRDRLDRLVKLTNEILGGNKTMSFNEFDTTQVDALREQYAEEAKQRWGATDAYKQSAKKTAKYSKEDWANIQKEADEIFAQFAANMDKAPDSPQAQALVERWQQHLSSHYYDCTKQILAGLGQMYVADERFKANIDKAGVGTAEFMSKAIESFCH